MLTYNEQYQEAIDQDLNDYYDDVANLQREGQPVPTIEEWQAENAKRRVDRYAIAAQANRDLNDEIPW
jgi:hypothetical protein